MTGPRQGGLAAVRVRFPRGRDWSWIGNNFQVIGDSRQAFTYEPEVQIVAYEVAARARSAGLLAQVVPWPPLPQHQTRRRRWPTWFGRGHRAHPEPTRPA